ncbi:MAG TPA: PqqD family protein [Blastocatellia bacterium]|nr:PqqD family protein [Blastocatellia bacterium]
MKQMKEESVFQARQDGLLKQAVDDELLVYDLKRHKAHCLNRTAALVWEECNGRNSVADLARIVQQELHVPYDEELVWVALDQLDRARLLSARIARPGEARRISRREVLKRVGLGAALAVPLITSIMSPTAAQAATCTKKGGACTSSRTCCSQVCSALKCL